EEDVAQRAPAGVAPLLAAAIPAHPRARRRKEDAWVGRFRRLSLLLVLRLGKQEGGNVDVVVDVEVRERDVPHPRPAYRPRSRKQRMAADGMSPSRGSPSAARRRRSVLDIASGGMRTCSTRHPGP